MSDMSYEPEGMFKELKICIHNNRGKYEGCYATDDSNVIETYFSDNPVNDFLCISKFAIEFAENQIWDNSVFQFPQKHPKYTLIDDEVHGKLLRENTSGELVEIK